MVDRKGGYLRIGLVKNRTKEVVKGKIIDLLSDFPVHTITCDNGMESAAYEEIGKALNATIYFTHPYGTWE